MYCTSCGAKLMDTDRFCPTCGASVQPDHSRPYNVNIYVNDPRLSFKSRTVALLLCIFLGYFGIHRFYVGKIGTGILWLCTFGFCGIGVLADLIIIATGTFKDANGQILLNW